MATKIPSFPRPTDVVIDLETLGNRWNAAVVSIGAAAFDRNGGKVGPTYYAEIKMDDALRFGRVTGSTLEWWMKQDVKARRVFIDNERKLPMYDALRGLNDFMRNIGSSTCVWGNGSHFDITLIERLMDTAGNGLVEQWKYTQVRDQRTIVDAAQVDLWDKKQFPREGVHHNALDDAVFQAGVIQACFKRINMGIDLLEKAAPKSAPTPVPATVAADDDEEL